jgi:rod shape-determining protein MreC
VHDKQVRRRRAVLGLLVVVSLILLTASFGSSPNSPLHSVQRGIVEVLSPLQQGASRALKPVRDLVGWFSDTLHAKDQRDQLRQEVARLRLQRDQYETALADNEQLRKLVGLDSANALSRYRPATGRVIGRNPTVWYAQVEVDKGTDDGVAVGDPVVNGDGLVGKVTQVTPSTAEVTLITDHTSGVSAKVLTHRGQQIVEDAGTVVPAVGSATDLIMQFVPRSSAAQNGDQVVTAGTTSNRLESLFPADIPIGTVTNVSQTELALNQRLHVHIAADLRHLDIVQVLTRPQGERTRAQAPTGSG